MVEGNVDYFTMVYYFMNVVICIYTHLHVFCYITIYIYICIYKYIYMHIRTFGIYGSIWNEFGPAISNNMSHVIRVFIDGFLRLKQVRQLHKVCRVVLRRSWPGTLMSRKTGNMATQLPIGLMAIQFTEVDTCTSGVWCCSHVHYFRC